MRARNIKVSLGWVGPTERTGLLNGAHGTARKQILAMVGVVAAELRVERLVLVRDLLAWGGFGLLGRNGAALLGRIDARGEGGEVAGAVAKLVLNREGRQPTEATASLVGLLKALRQQSSLESKSVERRQRGRHLAGARAGEVGERQAAHAGAGRRGDVAVHYVVGGAARGVEGLRAKFEAAGAVRVVFRHGREAKRMQRSARVSPHGSGWALVGRWR